MENIEENNKLIAEFMGAKTNKTAIHSTVRDTLQKTDYWLPIIGIVKQNKLRYHKSWDWLMPVVEKIETLFDNGIDVTIFTDGTLIENWREQKEIIRITRADVYFDNKIEATYEAVVQFISWYNENK